ncbi:MAG: hydrogenase subunit MbhD domain-containing protein [Spirochaetota bacterium]
MQIVNGLLVLFLVMCALAVAGSRDLLASVVIFAAYSAVMAVLWLLLRAPDVAITEAAIGAGVNTVVFTAVVSRITGGERR